MYNFVIFQELNVKDRLGKFTFVQWGFLGSGFLLAMFIMIMEFFPVLPSIFLGLLCVGTSGVFAFVERHGMPFYEFLFVYIAYRTQPKEAVYGSNSMDDYQDDFLEEEEEFEVEFF